jgi:membrane associated rhomboid family serine protease
MFPLKDSIKIPFAPLTTYFIILANAAVFLFQHLLNTRADYELSFHYGLVPRRYFDPAWAQIHGLDPHDYLPFITGTFMHGGLLHIVFNMWTLFIFGASLEGRIGRLGFLTFYLTCGLIASFAHAYFNMTSTVPAIGASGAIAGVIGAYATTFPKAKINILILIVIIPFFFKVPALAYALVWFGFQFLEGFWNLASPATGSGIAWWAHIGGFAAGFVLIPLWRWGPDRTYDEEQVRYWGGIPEGGSGPAGGGKPGGWTKGPWG